MATPAATTTVATATTAVVSGLADKVLAHVLAAPSTPTGNLQAHLLA